jgi:hypothetical protein
MENRGGNSGLSTFLKTATLNELAQSFGLICERLPEPDGPKLKGEKAAPKFRVYFPDAPERAELTSARGARALICRMGGNVTVEGDPA